MSSLKIQLYQPELKPLWDEFIRFSKNGSFLFYRDFIAYHEERFQDYSLLVFEKDKLIAVLPANAKNKTVFSHQGLTYGGLILGKTIKFRKVLACFQTILAHLDQQGFTRLEIKNIPGFYHRLPAEEADYIYFLLNAKVNQVSITSIIDLKNPLPIQKNRLEGVKKAYKNELKIVLTEDFSAFWKEILIPNLARTHNAKPVHSLEEISLLKKYFPKHIHQYNVLNAHGKIVAGACIFETRQVAHVQYISANEQRQQLGSLDFLFQHLIKDRFKNKRFFDFGTSNEQNGKKLNAGLQYWKEGFGARSLVHRSFQIETKNHYLLDAVIL